MSGFISSFLKKRQSSAEWIEEEASHMNFGLARVIKYEELKKATNNFSTELGNGGYGRVYLGKLQDGRMVAVKVLFDRNPKRLEQFFNEVTVLSRLRHKNLVSLYGCTSPRSQELLLVYEYVPNGTVADHLHGKRTTLTWAMRVQIAVETAKALVYLHTLEPPLIHRDVKTSNILLDYEFHVKVADLGICRLLPWDSTHVSTVPQGTMGYRDPEYERYFRLTDKTDVYSFGVVLMELISGQQAVDVNRDPQDIYLDGMALKNILDKKLDEFVDPVLRYYSNNDVRREIDTVAELAVNCLQPKGDMRPPMLHVLTVLKGIQTKEHQMQHQDGRQEEVHVKGIQHEKQQQDNNSFDLQPELHDESLEEVYHGSGNDFCSGRSPSNTRTEEQEEKRRSILAFASGSLDNSGKQTPSSPFVLVDDYSKAQSLSPMERAAEWERMILDLKLDIKEELQGLWLRLLRLGATEDPLSSFEYVTILAVIESDAEGIGGSYFVECIREHIHSGWQCCLTDEQFIAVKELLKTAINHAISRNDMPTIRDALEVSAEMYRKDSNNVSEYVQCHLLSRDELRAEGFDW